MNDSTLIRNNTELTLQQLWGTVVASAIGTRNSVLTAAVLAEASKHLSDAAIEAAKAAAAIMGMNNIYYRFQHLSSNEEYARLPARLRMNVLRSHGVEPLDFELWSLAVSAINGCGKCVDSHEKVVRDKGAAEELIAAVDVTLHGNGVFSRWVASASPGASVESYLPCGVCKAPASGRCCIFAGDETAAPSILTILQSLPDGVKERSFIEVESEMDIPLCTRELETDICWLSRDAGRHPVGHLLTNAITSIPNLRSNDIG
ncbi:carboxymuconolactone decarboxylase family protein [Granulicella tundricola]|uniref:carboxymuconolactone decarboxylase family protein n=1 Tax=Granulicella tundricola TaxID=940615 RepID=UPI0002E8E3BF|nr:carboxymuconolactone decarboxylase family protein [Granulicella tundricola]